MKNTRPKEEPIAPMSREAKRYLLLLIFGTLFGMVMIFLTVLSRYAQRTGSPTPSPSIRGDAPAEPRQSPEAPVSESSPNAQPQ